VIILKKALNGLIFPIFLSVALLVVYGLGINNGLIFDDTRLFDGTVFDQYGNLLQFRQRVFSYSTFVWVQNLFGDKLPVQRGVNLALHLGTCWALYQLFALLLLRIAYREETQAEPAFAQSQRAALRLGVMFYALNPVAVYAVAYLIQRSILMATLFGVLACWAFVRALVQHKQAWFVAAMVLYLLAVASKEHAFLMAGMALPLYVFVARPTWQKATAMLAVAGGVLLAAVALLLKLYPGLAMQVFDSTSQELAAQLDKQRPGVLAMMYPLSVLNEAALFFYYGALWVIPNGAWMSIDMHPAFPLSMFAMPQLLGALAYVALLAAAVVALVRRSDVWGFAGLCLLFPLVLFWTEFATVWVQDPFVLYRSYLWAIAFPGLIAVALTGWRPQTLLKVGLLLGLLLGASAVERVLSMRDSMTVWTDAVAKNDLRGPPNEVGKGRAYLYKGQEHMLRLEMDIAMRDFRTAQALGATAGEAFFAMGVAQHAVQRYGDALESFRQAEAAGYANKYLLAFHQGEAHFAVGRMEQAYELYNLALAQQLAKLVKSVALAHRAEAAMQLKKYAEAKADFEQVLAAQPTEARPMMGLGLAQLGLGDAPGALNTFEKVMAVKPDALAWYGQALAQHALGNKAAALEAIGKAVQLDPRNKVYSQVQSSIAKGEKLAL
jgi:tetratricopeptide (TPR) repeat protein